MTTYFILGNLSTSANAVGLFRAEDFPNVSATADGQSTHGRYTMTVKIPLAIKMAGPGSIRQEYLSLKMNSRERVDDFSISEAPESNS